MANPVGRPRKIVDDGQIMTEGMSALQDAMGYFPENEPLPGDMAIAGILGQLGEEDAGSVRVLVFRVDETTRKEAFLYASPAQEFAINGLETIGLRGGAGTYALRAFQDNTIPPKSLMRRLITIGKTNETPAEKAAQAVQAAPANIELLLANQTAMFMEGMKQIAASLNHAPVAPPPMGIHDVLALIGQLSPMMQGQRQHAPDPLDMLQKMLEIQKSITPLGVGPDGEVSSMGVIMKALETLGPVLMDGMAQRQQQQQAAIIQPQIAPQQLAAPVPNPVNYQTPKPIAKPIEKEMENMSNIQLALTVAKPLILSAAAQNADPFTYAGLILDNIDIEDVDKYIRPESYFDGIVAIMPEAKPYPEWFAALRAAIIEMLQPEENAGNVSAIKPDKLPADAAPTTD